MNRTTPENIQNNKPSELAQEADRLYAARERIENVRACVEILSRASTPLSYELAWRLGRALFFLGQQSLHKAEARAFHAQAVRICGSAISLEPERVEAHFWLGVNLSLLAQSSNFFKALLHALRAKRELLRAVRLDAAYHAAGPLRVLARLEHKLPALFGGRPERARAHFEAALSLAPNNTVTHLYFAEMLLEAGDREHALHQLEMVLNAPEDSGWSYEISRDRQLAQEMLERLRDAN